MVCTKCERLAKSTALATPGVKRKSEIYHGSSASTSASGKDKKPSATLGQNGIGKVLHLNIYERKESDANTWQSKLLSKAARNPYATYSSSCTTCKTKVDQGKTYCHKCAYKANGEHPLTWAGREVLTGDSMCWLW